MKRSDSLPDIQYAVSLHQSGKLAEAEQAYREILKHLPENFDANHLLGLVFLQRGHAASAAAQIGTATRINPDVAAAHNNMGNALRALQRPQEALASYDKATELESEFADAYVNRGIILVELCRFEEAVASLEKALAIRHNHADAFLHKGIALEALNRQEDALASYDSAIRIQPKNANAFSSRGNLLRNMQRYHEALKSYDRAIDLQPDFVDAYLGRGNTLKDLQQFEDAVASYDKAVALKSTLAEAWNNLGNKLRKINRREEALLSYQRATALNPAYAEAYNNMGNLYFDLNRFDEALVSYDKALSENSGDNYTEGMRLYTKLFLCDWRDFEASKESLLSKLRIGKLVTTPFPLLAVPSSTSEDQHKCGVLYATAKYPAMQALWQGERYGHKKIRIAYLSSNFREHAMSHLMAGLFEAHDRSNFETTAMSFGRNDGSKTRERIEASFDCFLDIDRLGDEEVAKLLRQKEIDIAIDLMGFTQICRLGIFARRPAPVQVSYIGFPGTLGASYIDYIIADHMVIPQELEPFFSEKIAFLPGTYYVNDYKRTIAAETLSRADLGLPETGFVFCCFNTNYKISPDIFDIWMRLLKAVDGSVLWLLDPGESATANLRAEGQKRGVPPEHLIFAPRQKLDAHLARYRQADLFLDTLPYNAHTTASDALWAGLPVLTCMGQTFAGRVAGSVLNAAGMPELITHSLDDYEKLALQLTSNPPLLAGLRAQLAQNRDTCALFDTERYARHLEAAYIRMWERYQKGKPPESFSI